MYIQITLDQPNFIYIVSSIKKFRFEYLAFTISSHSTVKNIFNTMIFINLFDKVVAITKFLHLRFFEHIKDVKKRTKSFGYFLQT